MRRLFWTFPDGFPGIGLLIMRFVTGATLLVRCVIGLWGRAPMEISVPAALLFAALAVLLLSGLWTPVAAALVAMIEFSLAVSDPADPWVHVLIGTLGVALALLGPGAWSRDAYLFGWKRIDIRGRHRDSNSP